MENEKEDHMINKIRKVIEDQDMTFEKSKTIYRTGQRKIIEESKLIDLMKPRNSFMKH